MKMIRLMLVTLVVTTLFLGSLSGLADQQEGESDFRYRLVGYAKAEYSWPIIASVEVDVDQFVMKNGTVGDFGGQTTLNFVDGSTLKDYERAIWIEVNEATREVWSLVESTTRPGKSNGHLAISYTKDGGPNGVDLFTGQTILWTREEAIDLCKQRPDFTELQLSQRYGPAIPMPLLEGDLELIIYNVDVDERVLTGIPILAALVALGLWRKRR
ncbi:MAG: hypothetical protein ACE5I5_17545 [Candidatus Heimdallarchaeota archaeon]